MINKNLRNLRRYIAIGAGILAVAGLLLPYVPAPVRVAQADDICVNNLDEAFGQQYGAIKGFKYLINKNKIYYDEKFRLYGGIVVARNKITDTACNEANAGKIHFHVEISFNYTLIGSGGTIEKDFPAVPWKEGDTFVGYQFGFEDTPKALIENSSFGSELKGVMGLDTTMKISAFAIQDTVETDKHYGSINTLPRPEGAEDHSPETRPDTPQVPIGSGSGGGTASDKVWVPKDMTVKSSLSADTYRIVEGNPDNVKITYGVDWSGASITTHPFLQAKFKRDGDSDLRVISGYYGSMAYEGTVTQCDNVTELAEGSNPLRCQDANKRITATDNAQPRKADLPIKDRKIQIPWNDYDKLKSEYYAKKTGGVPDKGPVIVKGYQFFPTVYSQKSATITWPGSSDTILELGGVKFAVEVYDTEEKLTAACIEDKTKKGKSADKAKKICDPKNNDPSRYESGDPVSGESGSNNQGKDSAGCGITDLGCWLFNFLARLIGAILSIIAEILYFIFYTLLVPILESIMGIRTYSDTFALVIYPGWQLIRNLGNVFFILALLITALATLFRFQGYQYKQILVDLVIAAILVNFSLVFGQAVLGIAETAQNQFLPNNQIVIRSLGKQLMVQPLRFDTWDAASQTKDSAGALGKITRQFVFLMLAVGAFLTFAAIAAYMLIRMVMLWILLMLSPVPYIARVLPVTKKYEEEWWTYFLKYAFFIPIMALFLNMTAVIANTTPKILESIAKDSFSKSSDLPSVSNFFFQVGSNILLLVFLYVGFEVAKKFGIYGADTITNVAKKGTTILPKLAAQAAGRTVKRKYDEKTAGLAQGNAWEQALFRVLHPAASVKAIREEGKRHAEIASGNVAAGAKLVARKTYGWRRKSEDPMFLYAEQEGAKLFEEEEGEWSDNEQQVVAVGNRLALKAKSGDSRDQMKFKHWLKQALRHRNLNEAMEGDNGLAQNLLGHKVNYDQNGIRYLISQLSQKGYIDHGFAHDYLKNLSKDGYETGDFNAVELVYSDDVTGEAKEIETEYDATTGSAKAVGWDEYLGKREAFIKQANDEVRADPTFSGLDEDALGVKIKERLDKLEEGEKKNNHKYENAWHADRTKMYMKVNMSKKKGHEQLGMFHDSLINVNVSTGKVQVSDAGEEALRMDMGKMYSLARDNMPPKTRDKFMQYINAVKKDEAAGKEMIENQVRKILENDYRQKGVYVEPEELEKQVAKQRNLWLAGGYALMSSQPGSRMSDEYIKGKSSEESYDAIIGAINEFHPDDASAA